MNITSIIVACLESRDLRPLTNITEDQLREFILSVENHPEWAAHDSLTLHWSARHMDELSSHELGFRLQILKGYLDRLHEKQLEVTPCELDCGTHNINPREQQRLDSQWILGVCAVFIFIVALGCGLALIWRNL